MVKTTESTAIERPQLDAYYMAIAVAVSSRAECVGLKVGAAIVGQNRVLSTGYNGTPEGWNNCSEGGACPRCDRREAFGSGNGYDKCICVHAEMNALAAAARYGIAVNQATVYVTHEPCLTCAKELAQAGISAVRYVVEAPGFSADDPDALKHLNDTRSRFLGQLNAERLDLDPSVTAMESAIETIRKAAT